MKKVILCCLCVISNYVWSQNDPYFKNTTIPADLKEQAQEFLNSDCSTIHFFWGEGRERCSSGVFYFKISEKYTEEKRTTETRQGREEYTVQVEDGQHSSGAPYYRTETRYRPTTEYEHYTTTVVRKRVLIIKEKLMYQKRYNNSVQIIEEYKGFDNKNFQDSVKNEIKARYSGKEYKKYLAKKEVELKQLIKEWKAVPLYDSEIKAQTIRVRSSWLDFKQERAKKLREFDLQCQKLTEAKRFVYKYENNIP